MILPSWWPTILLQVFTIEQHSKYFSQMHLFDSYVTQTLCIQYILNSCSSYIFSPKTDLSGFQTLSKNTFAILIHYLNYFCL